MSFILDYLYSFLYSESTKTEFKFAQKDHICKKTATETYETEDPHNFYYLSLIKEDDKPLGWSIHGLWPQIDKTTYPKFCRKVEFNIKKIKPLQDDLYKYWYSNKGTDEYFWKHEYEKHGSCNYNKFSEYDYFKTTIDLFLHSVKMGLPEKFYNDSNKRCLIPVDKQLIFFNIKNITN